MLDDDEDLPGPSPPDPTEDLPDPAEGLAPEVDVPSVENPADRLPEPSAVDTQVRQRFWVAVFWLDVAMAGLILGPAYAVFVGGQTIGAVVTLAGALAAFRVYQTYRTFRRETGERG